ncbi:MAG: bifunctional diaminohydroxyphosphoribosylaminopyrimidine deaminase/5-amino-6-(5-phosphoribosylamino)uracil reductase RibD [Burkholderiales bacterium]|nr:bifunctional diaminohydroxyphosphoribosylaminopyrimidine deaminase/5-amino-6-(5-phosphoribosylamino)uracil reductase RibD [Phycisphaerae bacterium]
MWTSADEPFSRRALGLAMGGRGRVEPNPMVGCVIVRDGQVIGEGFHAAFGGPHAEPTALSASTQSPRGATAYVTLEPCCHTNKKTPPCVPTLIEAGITRVVIGCLDPNPNVNGAGVRMLRDASIEVDRVPDGLGAECRQLIAPFLVRQQFQRPYVTMKWAQTADGKVAGHEGMRLQISGDRANAFVHTLRARSDAIVVGINTVLTDDPVLTVRGVPAVRTPERVIIDRKLRTPNDCRLVRTALQLPTVVVTSLTAPSTNFEPLVERGVRVVWPPAQREDVLLAALAAGDWVQKPYSHVLVEPGPTLANAFFKAGLCDRLWVIHNSRSIEDASAPTAATVPDWFAKTGELSLGADTLIEYLNVQSAGYHATVPSADFTLAQDLK